jgi:hypothetical protein
VTEANLPSASFIRLLRPTGSEKKTLKFLKSQKVEPERGWQSVHELRPRRRRGCGPAARLRPDCVPVPSASHPASSPVPPPPHWPPSHAVRTGNRSDVRLRSPERVPPAGPVRTTYILSERARIEGQFVGFGAASAGVARNGRLEPVGAVDAAAASADHHHSAAAAVGRTGRALAAVVRRLHAPVRAHHLRQAHGFLGFLFYGTQQVALNFIEIISDICQNY